MALPDQPPSYQAVLRTPTAGRTFQVSLVGRLSYGIVFLSLTLAITSSTGSYVVAGAAVAVFGLANSLLAPLRSGLIDRHGSARLLLPMGVAYALLLAVLAALTWSGATDAWLLVPVAAAAGACAPPLGPVMRTVWSDLLPDARMLQRAYSLDTVCEEVLYVTGPLLVGLLVIVADPPLGIAVSAALVLVGTLAFVRTPAVRAQRGTLAMPAPAAPDAAGDRHGMTPGPLSVAAALGLALGSLNLFVVAFAGRHGQLASVAWIEAALAVGSVVGGLLYGSLDWRTSARTRLAVLAAALAAPLALAGTSSGLPAMMAATAVTGLLVAPTLTTAYLLADEQATDQNRTRVGTWVTTAFNLGNAAGAAGAGFLVGALPLPACFALAAGPLLLSALAPLAFGPPAKPRAAADPGADELTALTDTREGAEGSTRR
ncbi:MFS transporter [Streptomyces longisporoflavus]|uniref:MFS transporter n=1 Tax=Streptomyces longisporoflavus TaxID=28044 RepID=UPI00167D8C05|nr:MFS transporter [Streptomyces longisporoflavus]GGV45116.1 MFS transporter [Streptomyces longisporoflavus]